MKNRTFPLLALLLLLSACSKKEEFPEIPVLIGEASATLNGQPVHFTTYAIVNNGSPFINIEIDGHKVLHGVDHNISFSQVPMQTGIVDSLFNYHYPSVQGHVYCNYALANGDALYAFYDLIPNHPDNHFEITDIDEKQHLIKGSFDLTLVIEPDHSDAGVFLPDTIHLRAGSFEAPLRE